MPNMLTKEDLKQIGEIVEEVVDRKFDEKLNDPQGVMNVKLDAVQEQLEGMNARLMRVENTMLTHHDLERWEVGLRERYDRRYVRR